MLEKAPRLGADIVMLDLEDAVAPDDKAAGAPATSSTRCASRTGRAARCRCASTASTRHWCYRDLVDVVEEAGDQLDQIMIPKVSCAGDVHFVATLLDQIEEAVGLRHRIGISVLIETAIGMVNIDEIATRLPGRMEAMVFGVADYAASLQSHTTSIGGANPHYAVLTDPNGTPERERHWGDQWHYALSRIAVDLPRARAAPDRRPVRRLQRPRGLPRRRAPRRRARLRGQVGDPPLADRAGQRGLHARRAHRREDPPDHRARCATPPRTGSGRGLARRPAHRRRLDPHGGDAARQARADRGQGERRGAAAAAAAQRARRAPRRPRARSSRRSRTSEPRARSILS